jgi:hypothetical protein
VAVPGGLGLVLARWSGVVALVIVVIAAVLAGAGLYR